MREWCEYEVDHIDWNTLDCRTSQLIPKAYKKFCALRITPPAYFEPTKKQAKGMEENGK